VADQPRVDRRHGPHRPAVDAPVVGHHVERDDERQVATPVVAQGVTQLRVARVGSEIASSGPSELSAAGSSGSSPSAILARCSATAAVHQPHPTSTGISAERPSHRIHGWPWITGCRRRTPPALNTTSRDRATRRRRTRANDESRQWRRRYDRLRDAQLLLKPLPPVRSGRLRVALCLRFGWSRGPRRRAPWRLASRRRRGLTAENWHRARALRH
jgi:hypothetical protein